MSSIDWMIDQQIKSGRPMDCSFIVLAERYKAIHDSETNPRLKIKAENDFRRELMLLPEFKPAWSRAIIAYVFDNPDNYTEAQKKLILKDHIEYLINSITPETKDSILGFLDSLMPSKKRTGKLGGHPALAALIQNRINNR